LKAFRSRTKRQKKRKIIDDAVSKQIPFNENYKNQTKFLKSNKFERGARCILLH